MSTTDKSVANADEPVTKGTKRAAEVRGQPGLELFVLRLSVFFCLLGAFRASHDLCFVYVWLLKEAVKGGRVCVCRARGGVSGSGMGRAGGGRAAWAGTRGGALRVSCPRRPARRGGAQARTPLCPRVCCRELLRCCMPCCAILSEMLSFGVWRRRRVVGGARLEISKLAGAAAGPGARLARASSSSHLFGAQPD